MNRKTINHLRFCFLAYSRAVTNSLHTKCLTAIVLVFIPLALWAQLPPMLAAPAQAETAANDAPLTPAQAIESEANLAQFQAQVNRTLALAPDSEGTQQVKSAFAVLAKQLIAPDEDFSLAPLPPLPVAFSALKQVLKTRQALQVELDLRKEINQEPAGLAELSQPRDLSDLMAQLRTLELAVSQKAVAREEASLASNLAKLETYLAQAASALEVSLDTRNELQNQGAQALALPKLDAFSGLLSFKQIEQLVQQQVQALEAISARAQLRLADRKLDVEGAARARKLAQRHLQASDAAFVRALRRSELSAGRLGKTAQSELENARAAARTGLRLLEDSVVALEWLESAERKQWLENTPWLQRQIGSAGLVFADVSGALGRTLNYGFFSVGGTPITLGGLGRLLLILLFAWFASKWLRGGLARYGERLATTSRPVLYSLGRVLHYVILAIGFSIALSSIGLDLSKVAFFATALGVGIGFGLQTIVSNFVSGLILLFERSLKLGDFVELASGVHGSVSDISIRATRITTNDNIDVLVPNSEFINGQVTNWTLRDARRRIKIPFGVAYGSDKELVKQAALEAAAAVPFTLASEGPNRAQVWLVEFGPSSLHFKLVIWLTAEAVYRPGAVSAAYCWALDDALRKHKIEMPFPQMDVNLRSFFGATAEQAQRRFHEPPEHSQVPAPVAEAPLSPSSNDALEDALEATKERHSDDSAPDMPLTDNPALSGTQKRDS